MMEGVITRALPQVNPDMGIVVPPASQSLSFVLLSAPGFPGAAAAAKSLQSCSTLCDPVDGRSPGSAIPGILQARTLEWGAIAFSAWLP